MERETQVYKHSLLDSMGAGVKSIVDGSRKPYFILEHRIGSRYYQTGEHQEIIVDMVVIGRDASCHVRFDEAFETVSRRHAAILREGNHWKLIPLSKTNPTLLNGKKVQKEWFLQSGDEIQCAANGPKLGIIIPPSEKATTGNISLRRRFHLFRKQVLHPNKQKWMVWMCILLILLVAGGFLIFTSF